MYAIYMSGVGFPNGNWCISDIGCSPVFAVIVIISIALPTTMKVGLLSNFDNSYSRVYSIIVVYSD